MPDKFNESHLCGKCGYMASSVYQGEYNVIQRTCQRCGYSWMELPLDYVKDPVNPAPKIPSPPASG